MIAITAMQIHNIKHVQLSFLGVCHAYTVSKQEV